MDSTKDFPATLFYAIVCIMWVFKDNTGLKLLQKFGYQLKKALLLSMCQTCNILYSMVVLQFYIKQVNSLQTNSTLCVLVQGAK